MLRLTVLLLLLANAAYFAWSQGLLAPWGIAPAQQSEPQRLEHQIKPQAVRILGSEEAGRLELAAAGPSSMTQECLQAGLFEERELPGLKHVLERWPVGSWMLEPAVEPALAARELRGQLLKLPAVDDNLRPRLEELRTALNGKPLRPCR
ncbi:MAG TPA: hypothetical protein VN663_22435 [Ramlibacter sp.]|nr:hypothetical protein [Ramlibacter sp.]